MKLTPPEGFNYKGAIVSRASARGARGSDRGQKIQLRGMAAKGKSYLCDRQQCNTRAQEEVKIQESRRGEPRQVGLTAQQDSIKSEPGERRLRKERACYKFIYKFTGSWLPGANLVLRELITGTKTLIWED